MMFEWDEDKRRQNLDKHGIDFVEVLALFTDPRRVVFEDDRQDYGEQRFILLGGLRGIVFQVVYSRRRSRIRIISARRANRKERRIHEQAQED